MTEWIKNSPKANQHLHLTGALTLPYIRENAHKHDLDLSDYEPLESKSFDEPDVWTLAKELTSTPEGFLDAMKHVIDTEEKDNVELIELTFNPYGMIGRGMTKEEIAAAVREASAYAILKNVHFIVRPGVNRKDGRESIGTVYDVYSAIDADNRWGIDLNGDEKQFLTGSFAPDFYDIAAEGINTSIHAGEFEGLGLSLMFALEARPRRIGHAVAAISHRDILHRMRDQGVTVEVASLSNIHRKTFLSSQNHLATEFIDQGIDVVFGTDDPTFFNNTMSDEFELLNRRGMRQTEIESLMTKFKQVGK